MASKHKMKITPEIVEQAKNLSFDSSDLNRELTIKEWLKTLLVTLLIEDEGFSGKRPFGNSGWTGDVEIALVRAGLSDGEIHEEDGDVDLVECGSRTEELLIAIVKSL